MVSQRVMTWQFTLTGLLLGLDRRPHRDGRRLADDADPRDRLRLQADVRGRHRHLPRRDLQVVRRDPAPAARHGARAAGALDVRRLRPAVAARRRASPTWITRHYGRTRRRSRATPSASRSSSAALGFLAKSFIKRGMQPSDAPFILERRDKLIALAIGAVFGFVVGLTSVGSGTFFGLVMVLVYPLTMAKIVGTDIFHAAALLWVAGIGHLISGNVDLHATAWLLLGSIPGVLISSRFTVQAAGHRAPRRRSATILMLSGLKLLNVPKASWILVGGLVGARVRPRGLRACARGCAAARRAQAEPKLACNAARVESPGFAAGSLDGDAPRPARRHGRGVRDHRAAEAREEPDLRAPIVSERVLAGLRLRPQPGERSASSSATTDTVTVTILTAGRTAVCGRSSSASAGASAAERSSAGTARTDAGDAGAGRRCYRAQIHLASAHRTIRAPEQDRARHDAARGHPRRRTGRQFSPDGDHQADSVAIRYTLSEAGARARLPRRPAAHSQSQPAGRRRGHVVRRSDGHLHPAGDVRASIGARRPRRQRDARRSAPAGSRHDPLHHAREPRRSPRARAGGSTSASRRMRGATRWRLGRGTASRTGRCCGCARRRSRARTALVVTAHGHSDRGRGGRPSDRISRASAARSRASGSPCCSSRAARRDRIAGPRLRRASARACSAAALAPDRPAKVVAEIVVAVAARRAARRRVPARAVAAAARRARVRSDPRRRARAPAARAALPRRSSAARFCSRGSSCAATSGAASSASSSLAARALRRLDGAVARVERRRPRGRDRGARVLRPVHGARARGRAAAVEQARPARALRRGRA